MRPLRTAGVALVALSCSAGRGPGAQGSPSAAEPEVELHRDEGRPPLALVERLGDPVAAAAIAVATPADARAAAALAALAEERLARAAELRIAYRGSSGFVATAALEPGTRVEAVLGVLDAPVTDAEARSVEARLAGAPPPRRFRSPAEAAVGLCSGDHGEVRAPAPLTAAALEAFRQTAVAGRTATAAVGPRATLDAARRAHDERPPHAPDTAPQAPWPAADLADAAPGAEAAAELSVALLLPRGDRALEAAEALGASGSVLRQLAAAHEPPLTVTAARASLLPRGACLRVDVAVGRVRAAEAARLAELLRAEMTRALDHAPEGGFAAERAVLAEADPLDAAAVAAWQALHAPATGAKARTFVHLSAAAPLDAELTRFDALVQARRAPTPSTVELRAGLEPGQGEAWVLVASPCATLTEGRLRAGASAFAVRALAAAGPELDGVRIEPWVSADGIGLFAHAARRAAAERPAARAARLGAALGRVLATVTPPAEVLARVRSATEAEIGPGADPLWPAALDALAPEAPALLDPRGTPLSIPELPAHAVETERRALVRGPLRLAVLAGTRDEADAARAALGRFVEPLRDAPPPCPASPVLLPRSGEWSVRVPGAPGTRGLVAVPIRPDPLRGIPRAAEWTAHLLGRPGGWLERSLGAVPGARHVAARVVGGPDAAALVVDVGTAEGGARAAVDQIRGLLARLAAGAASAPDVAAAEAEFRAAERLALRDPRARLVRLWLGRPEAAPTDLAALRRFHAEALAPERHVVVLGRP